LPQWQSTHPDPGNRIKATERRLDATTANLSTMKVGEAEFLQMIDGMVFGDNPRQGFFRGSLFLHPDLKFRFQFPNGWQTQNTNAAVMAMSSAQDALIQLQVASGTAAAASRAFFSQQGLVAGGISQTSIHGFPARTGEFSAQTGQGTTVRGTATFIGFSGTTCQLLACTTSDKFNTCSSAFRTSVTSFDRLPPTSRYSRCGSGSPGPFAP
jgi:predicted Zn-dependent protease